MSDDHADDAEEFLDALDTFAVAVRRTRGTSSTSGQTLTLSQYGLLEPLTTAGSARIGDLAAAAGITAPTATRILDALERRGIVRRARVEDDRRTVTVTLTEAGQDVLARHHEAMRRIERGFYAELCEEERRVAPDLLRRLAGLIDALASVGVVTP